MSSKVAVTTPSRSVRLSMDRGSDRIILENGAVRVVLLPSSGGRIESLQGEGFEFLLQPSDSSDQQLIPGMRFQDGPCSGMDECLPTVARSGNGVQTLKHRIMEISGQSRGQSRSPLLHDQ